MYPYTNTLCKKGGVQRKIRLVGVESLLTVMLLLSIIFVLISNSVTVRRDLAILFNRIAIIALMYCLILSYFTISLENKGIGLHGGLLYVNNYSKIFSIVICSITIIVLQLTSFHPRKV